MAGYTGSVKDSQATPSIQYGSAAYTGDAASSMAASSMGGDAMSHFTMEDRGVPAPAMGSIAASSTVDAGDVGIQLDALGVDLGVLPLSGSASDLQDNSSLPGHSTFDHQLTWEEERELALRASIPESMTSSVDYFAPASEISGGTDAWAPAPVYVPTTGLQSIDERRAIADAPVDAAILGVDLDALDSSQAPESGNMQSMQQAPSLRSAPSMTGSERERHDFAEKTFDQFMLNYDNQSMASGSAAYDEKASVVSEGSMDSGTVSQPRLLPDNFSQSSAPTMFSDGPTREAGELGLNLDAGDEMGTTYEALQSRETTFGAMDDVPDLQSDDMLQSAGGVNLDALRSTSSMRSTSSIPTPAVRELDPVSEEGEEPIRVSALRERFEQKDNSQVKK